MTTKQKAIKALANHCIGATLIDESSELSYCVQLEAPKGHHWDGSVHCQAVPSWYKSDPKSEYWAFVIEEIKQLPPAVKCDDNDCEGIATWGECEYWEEE